MTTMTQSRSLFQVVADTYRASVANYAEKRALSARFDATFRELNRLSDRDLADIGIHRSDIEDVARQHVYG